MLTTRLDRFFRNPDTGAVVVAQKPNPPLWLFLAATLVRLLLQPDGAVGTAVRIVGTASITVWAILEIVRGDSPFRRAVGALVLLGVTVGLLVR